MVTILHMQNNMLTNRL